MVRKRKKQDSGSGKRNQGVQATNAPHVIRLEYVLMPGVALSLLIFLVIGWYLRSLLGGLDAALLTIALGVAFSGLIFLKYEFFRTRVLRVARLTLSKSATRRLRAAYAFSFILYIIISIAAALAFGQLYSSLIYLAFTIFCCYYLLRMLDYQTIVAPARAIDYVLPNGFLAYCCLPILYLLFPQLQTEFPIDGNLFYTALFWVFGASALVLSYESAGIKDIHPAAWLELRESGFYNLLVSYMFIGSSSLNYVIHPQSQAEVLTYAPLVVMAAIVTGVYATSWSAHRKWLKKTIDGMKTSSAAKYDHWLPTTASQSRFGLGIGMVLLGLAVSALYVGAVLIYESLAAPGPTSIAIGLLMVGSSFSIFSYSLRRIGLVATMQELKSYIGAKEVFTPKGLRDRLNVQISLFAGTIGALVTIVYGIAPITRTLSVTGIKLTDADLLYFNLFVILILLIISMYYRFGALGSGISYSEHFLSSIGGVVEWTFRVWVILWGGITGTIAYSLGIPVYVDGPIIVAFVFVITAFNWHLVVLRARERQRQDRLKSDKKKGA